MTSTECVVCDYTVDLPEPEFESGLTGVQVPTPLYLQQIEAVENEMAEHLGQHTTTDFVEALHKADAYIAELEAELEQARSAFTEYRGAPDVRSSPPLQIPPEWAQGLQSPVTRREEQPALHVQPSEENPHGLRYPNGRPSLRPPGRSGA